MSETVEIGGEPYKLSDNPSLGTVRKVQSMQMDILLEYIDEDDLREMDTLEDEGELIRLIIENEGYGAFQDVMWETSAMLPIQTISLACDEKFDTEVFDEIGAQDFKDIKNKSEDALGGDANDFFNALGINTSMTDQAMKQKASEVTQNGT